MMWILLIFGALLLIAAFVFKYMQEDKIFIGSRKRRKRLVSWKDRNGACFGRCDMPGFFANGCCD